MFFLRSFSFFFYLFFFLRAHNTQKNEEMRVSELFFNYFPPLLDATTIPVVVAVVRNREEGARRETEDRDSP